tara:strand:- start:3740 stop:5044 length:1305 start_codon:yes stop_codon:yes gene_type:complete
MVFSYLKQLSPAKKNFSVGIVNMLLRSIITLFLIPFYIRYLGNDTYADWIILYSLPAIFELTNLGINKGVNNTFTILFNQKKDKESKKLLSMGITITLIICIITISIIFIFWNFLGIRELIGIKSIPRHDTLLIILLLTLKIFFDMIRGILCSFFIAKNEAYNSYIIYSIQYLLEVLLIVLILANLYSLSYVAIALTSISILTSIILYIYVNINYNYRLKLVTKNINNFNFIKSSLGFSLITLSQYIREQGTLIIIKNFFNSDVFIIYNTSRILTNYLNVFSGQIMTAVSPVFNFYYSKKLQTGIKNLYYKTNYINIFSSISFGLLIIVFRKDIWKIWLNNSIKLDDNLLLLLVLCAVLRTLWIASKSVIVGSNKHFNFSVYSLIISSFSVLLLILLFNYIEVNIYIAPIILIFYNLMIILFFSKYKVLSKSSI